MSAREGALVAVAALLASCGPGAATSTPRSGKDAAASQRAVRTSPEGPVPSPPLRFEFPDRPEARSCRLTIRDRAGREIANVVGPGSPLILPDGMQDIFTRGEPYSWSVAMTGEGGRPLPAGPGATFTVLPAR